MVALQYKDPFRSYIVLELTNNLTTDSLVVAELATMTATSVFITPGEEEATHK